MVCWLCGFVGRERQRGREERDMGEKRERNELFILFDKVVYITLMSCMLK